MNELATSKERVQSSNCLIPRSDFYEDENHFFIELEMPGIPKDNINISMENGILKIVGASTSEEASKDGRKIEKYRYERNFRMPLPQTEEKIKVEYDNGLLKIQVEKPENSKPLRISIK